MSPAKWSVPVFAGVAMLLLNGGADAACTVKIENPSVRLNPVPDRPGAGYMTLTATCPDTLLSAASPQAERIEIHQHQMAGSVMKMVKVDTVTLAPGQPRPFQPMGYHLMIFNVKQPAPKSLPITLTFGNGGEQTADFPVK